MSQLQACRRRGRSRSSASEVLISMRFSTCPPTTLSSSSKPALAEGLFFLINISIFQISWYAYVDLVVVGSNADWRGSRWPWSRNCARLWVLDYLFLLQCFIDVHICIGIVNYLSSCYYTVWLLTCNNRVELHYQRVAQDHSCFPINFSFSLHVLSYMSSTLFKCTLFRYVHK